MNIFALKINAFNNKRVELGLGTNVMYCVIFSLQYSSLLPKTTNYMFTLNFQPMVKLLFPNNQGLVYLNNNVLPILARVCYWLV